MFPSQWSITRRIVMSLDASSHLYKRIYLSVRTYVRPYVHCHYGKTAQNGNLRAEVFCGHYGTHLIARSGFFQLFSLIFRDLRNGVNTVTFEQNKWKTLRYHRVFLLFILPPSVIYQNTVWMLLVSINGKNFFSLWTINLPITKTPVLLFEWFFIQATPSTIMVALSSYCFVCEWTSAKMI